MGQQGIVDTLGFLDEKEQEKKKNEINFFLSSPGYSTEGRQRKRTRNETVKIKRKKKKQK
jgi:hypothetical protein